MSLGFEQAGFDVVCAVENDPVHCATHDFNFPATPVLCADIALITGRDIRTAAGLGDKEVIDCVFGGPPCQGFSFIGKRLVDDSRNALLGHFIRLVGELRPKYVVMENVPGIISGGHREILDEAIRELQSFEYSVVTPQRILNAYDFGVPQKRRRFFLLAWAAEAEPLSYPMATSGAEDRVSVADAIADLPSPEDYPSLLEGDSEPRAKLSDNPSAYAMRLRGDAADEHDFSYCRKGGARGLTSSMRTVHTTTSRGRFAATPPGSVEPISRFLRLDPYGACNTLRAGTAAERGAHTSPRPLHPSESRCITVREAARLHSYPDWFRFHSTKWHGFRQVGNSVPPLLARAVASSIAVALDYKPVKPDVCVDLGDPALLTLTPGTAAARFGVAPLPGRQR